MFKPYKQVAKTKSCPQPSSFNNDFRFAFSRVWCLEYKKVTLGIESSHKEQGGDTWKAFHLS